ncbi:hypothetical protein D9758_012858 [Tetrapyrgos nigripes]|uniref:histone acetyltransferase n=1 Tax=Tetrapyrgos nigripes TaxID=182062 RepID=A0A8H5CD05_9AGAR|nr:hypothetical protein D9758_012858 [Tetrapyrgos nigripes]
MPPTHVVTISHQTPQHTVLRHDREEPVIILQERDGDEPEVYIHYVNLEKRHDDWVPKSLLQPMQSTSAAGSTGSAGGGRKRKRAGSQSGSLPGSRSRSVSSLSEPEDPEHHSGLVAQNGVNQTTVIMTEDEFDFQHHRKIYAQRNFDKVIFGQWLIKTWYFSPYPLTENEDHEPAPSTSNVGTPKIPGLHKSSRSHARTTDLFAGGLNRFSTHGEKPFLWVCGMCFKYMTDSASWELHTKNCLVKHPPGNKVYQRGAHTIWEVDGAKAKLYCQNLSLFGKLFIDVKTLFFDCDNFLFYILTDATSQKDNLLGFFSKEKVSYDDYNLACILTLPPFQKQGFGALMIEFSYELSRREGKTGTPERPLSDLGLRSYLSYWVSALIRFFRKLLTVLPLSTTEIVTKGTPPDLGSPSRESSEDGILKKRKKSNKGWDGEVYEDGSFDSIDDKLASFRHFVTKANPDGSATTHVRIECTLADIAEATSIRVEDAAFALQEVGLLDRCGQIRKPGVIGDAEDPDMKDDVVILTREMIEKVAIERKVKKQCLIPNASAGATLQLLCNRAYKSSPLTDLHPHLPNLSMLSVQRARALVAIFVSLCITSFQPVAASSCNPDFDDDCFCDDYDPQRNCNFGFRHRSKASIIAGAVVAGVTLICLIIAALIWKRRRDRVRAAQSQAQAAAVANGTFNQPFNTTYNQYYPPPNATYGQDVPYGTSYGAPYGAQGGPNPYAGGPYNAPTPGAPDAAHLYGNQSSPSQQHQTMMPNPFETKQ